MLPLPPSCSPPSVGQESSQCGSVTIPRESSRTGHNVQGRTEADYIQFLLPASTWPKAKAWLLICEQRLSRTWPGLAWPGLAFWQSHVFLVSSVSSFCFALRVGPVFPAFSPGGHRTSLLGHVIRLEQAPFRGMQLESHLWSIFSKPCATRCLSQQWAGHCPLSFVSPPADLSSSDGGRAVLICLRLHRLFQSAHYRLALATVS